MPSNKQPVSGQALVADFQTVLVSLATVEAAQYEADRSENELVQQLESIGSGAYLNPGALVGVDQDDLTRASLDAHIKKVQTKQLNAMGDQQLQSLIEQDQALYRGRRVTVAVLPGADQPIDLVWFDPQTGYRTSTGKKKSVSGLIEDVLLDRNLLIIKPSWGRRLINSRLHNYVVYIVDPTTFKPMVGLTVS